MTASHTVPGSRGQTFTLMEMLVVIAVILILASMLLPAMQRAVEMGHATTCLNSFRQHGIAVHTYGGENGNVLPLFTQWSSGGYNLYWPTLLAGYQGGGVWNYAWATATPKTVQLLYQCPMGKNELNWGLNLVYNKRCGNLANGVPASGLAWMDSERFSDVKNPTGAVLIADGANLTYSPTIGFENGGGGQPVWVDFRHNNGLQTLFVDGHAAWTSFPWSLPGAAITWAN